MDSLRDAFNSKSNFSIPDPGNMPVKIMENKGEFKYNNGKGFDVYVMKTDNMPCLVPDATFKTNMPGAKAYKMPNSSIRP